MESIRKERRLLSSTSYVLSAINDFSFILPSLENSCRFAGEIVPAQVCKFYNHILIIASHIAIFLCQRRSYFFFFSPIKKGFVPMAILSCHPSPNMSDINLESLFKSNKPKSVIITVTVGRDTTLESSKLASPFKLDQTEE